MLVVPFFRIRIGVFNRGPGDLWRQGQGEVADERREMALVSRWGEVSDEGPLVNCASANKSLLMPPGRFKKLLF